MNPYLFLFLILLAGCSSKDISKIDDDYETATRREKRAMESGKFFGDDTFIFGGDGRIATQESQAIAVNKCLWRATLEILSFLPIVSADPFGGVILTDWYGDKGDERLKVNVRILDARLRADALKISVFRQKFIKGQWIDVPADGQVAQELEDAVLTKARELHLRSGV